MTLLTRPIAQSFYWSSCFSLESTPGVGEGEEIDTRNIERQQQAGFFEVRQFNKKFLTSDVIAPNKINDLVVDGNGLSFTAVGDNYTQGYGKLLDP